MRYFDIYMTFRYNKKMNEIEKKQFNRLDLLFRQMKACNDELMNDAPTNFAFNEEQNNLEKKRPILIKAYLFYLSSFGISYVKNLFLSNANSLGNIMNMRCIIEGAAMHSRINKFTDDEVELFRLQPYLLEYNTYKKYKIFDDVLLNFSTTEESYKAARQHYKGTLNLNSKEVNVRLNTKYPFLSEGIGTEDIIRQEFGEDFLKIYKMLSMLIHPHDYRNELCLRIHDDVKKIDDFINQSILLLLENIFNFILSPKIMGLQEEYDLLFFPHSIQYQLRELTSSLIKMIKSIMDVSMKNGFSCLESWLRQIHLINMDYALDNAFGYVEQGIIKWKQVVEFFAVLNLFANDDYFLRENKLLWIHSQISALKNISGENTSEEAYDAAYSEYIKRYSNDISKEEFTKNYNSPLGFLINANGETPSSLKKLAEEFIDEYSALIDNNLFKALEHADNKPFESMPTPEEMEAMIADNRLVEREIQLNEFLKMCYEESQIMSHATGYMFFANSGAWTSGQALSIYIHKFSDVLFGKLLIKFQDLKSSDKIQGKTFINVIRNYKKRSNEIINQIDKLIRTPKVRKKF